MGDTNLDNLRPITTFTIDGWKYEKLENGQIQRTSSDGTVEIGGSDVYYNAIEAQLRVIQFFKDHRSTFLDAVRSRDAICNGPETLLTNFELVQARARGCGQQMAEPTQEGGTRCGRENVWLMVRDRINLYRIWIDGVIITVGDGDRDGRLDTLSVPDANLYGNDFTPLISAILMIGVTGCTNPVEPGSE